MSITSRESAIVSIPFHRMRACSRGLSRGPQGRLGRKFPEAKAQNCVRVNFGVQSISQPPNAEVKANFRVFPGFMGVFWNLGWMELQIGSICCTYNKQTSKMMWCLYNRFGFPAVPVTKVRQTLPQCVDTRKIHLKGVKKRSRFPWTSRMRPAFFY